MAAFLQVVLVWVISSAIAKILLSLGVFFVSFVYISNLVDDAVLKIKQNYYALPADFLSLLSIAGVPSALSVILSSFLIAATIRSARVWFGTSK